MADQNTTPRAQTHIPIKRLGGVENMNGATINHVLDQIWTWIHDFYDLSAGHRKVNGGFPVEEFSGYEFDLSTSLDLINGIVPFEATQPFLFISDLIGFVEQIRTSLTRGGTKMNIKDQRDALSELSKTFALLGINTDGYEISIEDLQKLDDPQYTELRNRALKRIEEMQKILRPLIKTEEKVQSVEEILEEETPQEGGADAAPIAAILTTSEQTSDGPEGGVDEAPSPPDETEPNTQRQPRPIDEPLPQQQPTTTSATSFKLSELSPEAKLYVQSLSIITINRALEKYFPDKSITFDQLPLGVRQQLMDRSFVHVHNLLLSGKEGFELKSLIKNTEDRNRFGDECAIDLLLDIQGVNTLSNFLKEYRQNKQAGKVEEQIEQAKQEKIDPTTLNPEIAHPDVDKNILNSAQAVAHFANAAGNNLNDRYFESLMGVISNSQVLNKTLVDEFSAILGNKDLGRTRELVEQNIIPTIAAFAQEGLPPSFLLSGDRLDYSKFKEYFGSALMDGRTFAANEAKIVILLKSYWLQARAIAYRVSRRETSQERYSREEAAKMAAALSTDKKLHDRHHRQVALLRGINRNFGSDTVFKTIAGQIDPTDGEHQDPILALYQEAQKESHLTFFQEFLKKEGVDGSDQNIMDVFIKFYLPAASMSQYQLKTTTTITITQVSQLFSPYDLYSIHSNDVLGTGFEYVDNGQSARLNGQDLMRGFENLWQEQAGGLQPTNDGFGGKLARETLKWGGRAALGAATGGASEAAFLQWEALKAADKTGISQMVEDAFLNQVLEKIKKFWPALLLGLIAPLLPLLSVLGGLLLAARNLEAIKNFLGLGKSNLASSAGQSSGIGSYSALEREALAAQQAQAAASVQAAAATAVPAVSPAMAIAGQAVLYTAIGSGLFAFLYYANLNSAFLTHFPFSESEMINTVEKTSKYAEMKKTAKIVKGCFATENDGSKCENPNFPVTIEYTIVINTKEDFAIQITDITDTIKFRQNKEAWNDNPPPIAVEKVLDMDYFLPIISKLGGLSSVGLGSTTSDILNEDPLQPTPDPSQQFIVLQPGQQLTFSYTLENLDANYHHTSIVNTIEVGFRYQNAVEAGADKVGAMSRVCLGNCAKDMCWPATGYLSQLPFGEGTSDADASHRPPNAGGWFDSYDLASLKCGTPAAKNAPSTKCYQFTESTGPMVYARFDGTAVFKGCSVKGYGCHYILEFELDGEKKYEVYAHLAEPNSSMSEVNKPYGVQAGQILGKMGTTGNSSGVHLHFGLATQYGSGLSSKPSFSILEKLVPPDDAGNEIPKLGSNVTTCYE